MRDLLEENDIECFLPLVKKVSQWSDRKKTISKPLFPSYIFVRIEDIADFHTASNLEGVVKYVNFGRDYARISEKEIDKIRLLTGEKEFSDVEIKSDVFKIGDVRKVAIGPFRGMECEIVKINNVDRIIVRLEALQQVVTASIPSYYFE